MSPQPSWSINTNNNIASLNLYVNGIIETTYTLQNGLVTLSERGNSAVLTKTDLRINSDFINEFIKKIKESNITRNRSSENIKEEYQFDEGVLNVEWKREN